jgi:hypothetical protein
VERRLEVARERGRGAGGGGERESDCGAGVPAIITKNTFDFNIQDIEMSSKE